MNVIEQIKNDMNIKFLKKISKLNNKKHRFVCLYGSAGSGKSYFTAQLILVLALSQPNNILVCRAFMTQNRESTFNLIRDLIYKYDLEKVCKINSSSLEINFQSGCTIFFRGAKEPEKLKSINNVTIGWIEEADSINFEDFLIVNGRIRGDDTSKIFLTFNPTAQAMWIKKHLIEGEFRKDTFTIHANLKFNKFIDKNYINNLKRTKDVDEDYYKIYFEGEWASGKSQIYTNYEVKQFQFKKEYGNMYVGLDFGYNNPAAAVLVQKIDKTIYVRELLYKKGLLTADIADKLAPYKDYIIYADSAEPDRIEEIKRKGFKIFPAAKNVKSGIDYIKMHKLIISPTSKNLIEELESYRWKTDRSGNILDEPVKADDHLMDALRYAIYTPYKLNHFSDSVSNLLNLIKIFPY